MMELTRAFRPLLEIGTLVAALAAVFVAVAAQVPAGLTLGAIEVVGTKRYTSGDLMRPIGLSLGQPITVEDLARAAERLADTGLVSSVTYRYALEGGQLSARFEIEEPEWTLPVILDSFVWFTDDELSGWLRRDVPTFDGTAPRTQGITALIARSLQSLMEARGVEGQVRYFPQTDMGGRLLAHLFVVRDPAPMLCAVELPGASAVLEAELLVAVRPFVGSEYSRGTMENVARGTLPEMYRRRSYWGARVAAPVPIPDPGCGGAIVRIAVDEGRQYTWQRTEWIGVSALDPRALDRAMRLSRGRPAGLTAIDDGLLAVRRAYERQGYIRPAIDYEPQLDAESGTMVLRVEIAEGPLFRFGSVEFDGAAAPHARALERRWRLKPGDAYDRLYAERFGQEEVRPLVGRRDRPPARLSFQERVDEATQLVHVRFVVGSS